MIKKINIKIHTYTFAIFCIFLCFTLSSCSFNHGDNNVITTPANSPENTDGNEMTVLTEEEAIIAASNYMKDMTVEEKIGQLFVVNLEQLDTKKGNYFEWKKCTKRMVKSLEKYHVGGVILFSRNIAGRKQTINLINKLQEGSATPLFVTVDEEGGEVARIGGNKKMKTTAFPTMEEIGNTKDADYVYDMGVTIGSEIKELGFNVDFAPVADVKTSELNLEIGSRSFGDNPDKVAEMVTSFVKGIQSQNVSAALKHFPGQGSSNGDTHIDSVNIDSSIMWLRKNDFVPFEEGIEAGADFVMVSHISVSKVTETSQPASMSELIMDTILREELGFHGVIVTDAMDMASITNHYTSAEAAYGAVKGGADIVLMPVSLDEAYNEILTKVNDGKISSERLDESVLRILTVKFKRGII